MHRSITKDSISCMMRGFKDDSYLSSISSCAIHTDPKKLLLNWNAISTMTHNFSSKVGEKLAITNQKRSGRCWLYAATNALRVDFMKKYNLKDFEFSQGHLFFWDKFEKANFFFESILSTLDEDYGSRLLSHILFAPFQDGGQWHMFTNLVDKHGLLPSNVYPDLQISCSNSQQLTYLLTKKLRIDALRLRDIAKSDGMEAAYLAKKDMMYGVFTILALHFGIPPEEFDWEYSDRDGNGKVVPNMTPNQFARECVEFSSDSYLCFVNSPRDMTPFNKTYTIGYLGNVVEGREILYINIPMSEMKDLVLTSLNDKSPVWFGADVAHMCDKTTGIMKMDIYNFDSFYRCDLSISKGDAMLCGDSAMNHAMLFTGVDDRDGRDIKWCVENSWGESHGDKGYFVMSDCWFNNYVYEVVIDRNYLPKHLKSLEKIPPIVLDPWDPLGALA